MAKRAVKRVEQKRIESADCGVACVAVLVHKSYGAIERAFREADLVSEDPESGGGRPIIPSTRT